MKQVTVKIFLLRNFVIVVGSVLCLFPWALTWAKGSCGKGGKTGTQVLSYNGSDYKILVPANYQDTTPMAMLLALHTDDGNFDITVKAWNDWVWSKKQNFILVAPRAPYPAGTNPPADGSHSWWRAQDQNAAWLDGLIKKILADYNVDLDRFYVTGWSGGACFLSIYALQNQGLFAAAQFNTCGCNPTSDNPPLPSCKIPARITIGSLDTTCRLTKNFYNLLVKNGHETVYVEVPNVSHTDAYQKMPQQMFGDAWDWLTKHTLCGTTTTGPCGGGPNYFDAGSNPVSDSRSSDYPISTSDSSSLKPNNDFRVVDGKNMGNPLDDGGNSGNENGGEQNNGRGSQLIDGSVIPEFTSDSSISAGKSSSGGCLIGDPLSSHSNEHYPWMWLIVLGLMGALRFRKK